MSNKSITSQVTGLKSSMIALVLTQMSFFAAIKFSKRIQPNPA